MNEPSKPGSDLTGWDNLKKALAHCDKCNRFVSENPWSVCPHCGYDIWDDLEEEAYREPQQEEKDGDGGV